MNNYREETNRLKKRVQELEEERTRLHRTTSSHSSQVERVKKSLEETKTQYAVVESERNTLKKECESAKRALSQQASELKSASTRLQRALEEVERLKNELDGLRSRNRDTNGDMKHTIERLTSDNRRLERQKTELIAAFKKQLRLIDVLRRQKVDLQFRCIVLRLVRLPVYGPYFDPCKTNSSSALLPRYSDIGSSFTFFCCQQVTFQLH
ncbi:unnamed protein product [Dicrocoelium dendriticum]|nr:unnamed protein product [Dicrocoelium dendriticum]